MADDARRRAEEALAFAERKPAPHPSMVRLRLVSALRALLSAPQERLVGVTETAPITKEQWDYLATMPDPAAKPAPAALPEAVRKAVADALSVLTELEQSAAYWSEYDVPLGIVERVKATRAALDSANAAREGKGGAR